MSQAPARPTPKRPVSRPRLPLPKGAIDTHAHVFGPFDRFPLAAGRPYEPPLAPAEDYLAMLDTVGFAGGVLVHASAKGFDNRNVEDTIARRPDRIRGIAVVAPGTPRAELERLHARGLRGLRFTDNGRPPPPSGALALADVASFLPSIRALGWQIAVWGLGARIMANAQVLRDAGVPVVIDHMGFFDTDLGVGQPLFQDFLRLVRDSDVWVKLTPVRMSKRYGEWTDTRPFHDALLAAIPDRCIYGGDWPYIGYDEAPPDAGLMVDLFDAWTPDAGLRQKVLVDNPHRLYGI